MTKVPSKARSGIATVTSKGSSGSDSAPFTVLSKWRPDIGEAAASGSEAASLPALFLL
jgi:hypothetical protein